MEVVCRLNSISKQFGDRMILENFSLEIEKGELLCVSGPSGSGKSTLLNILGMFEKPEKGGIEMFGEPIPDINSKKGRLLMKEKILYLFQNYALVDDKSIDYNLEIPLIASRKSRKEKERMKIEALRKMGIEMSLKKKIFQLSGGEQQRVSLARGFLKDFDLVLADEPTGSLDIGNRDIVMDALKRFQREEKTIIIVSHDPYIVESCSRVIRIG